MPVTVQWNFRPDTRPAQPRRFIRISDGDTPAIEQPIRAVSCDTPEKAGYAGKPPLAQQKLDLCRERLGNGFYDALPVQLRDYLVDKLGDDAAERHIGAAMAASSAFDQLLAQRLTDDNGNQRRLAIIPTGEIVDTYGRMLAYFSPWYRPDELPPADDPRRRTFNLDMIELGWAAFFPVYPSLPRPADMNRAIASAELAWNEKRGAWDEFGDDLLLGYEYRMCIKLARQTVKEQGVDRPATAEENIESAFQRVCIDLRTMQNRGIFGFASVAPPYRLWVWLDDQAEATAALGIV
jgi:endonuclease YncB( thermonuclease family)